MQLADARRGQPRDRALAHAIVIRLDEPLAATAHAKRVARVAASRSAVPSPESPAAVSATSTGIGRPATAQTSNNRRASSGRRSTRCASRSSRLATALASLPCTRASSDRNNGLPRLSRNSVATSPRAPSADRHAGDQLVGLDRREAVERDLANLPLRAGRAGEAPGSAGSTLPPRADSTRRATSRAARDAARDPRGTTLHRHRPTGRRRCRSRSGPRARARAAASASALNARRRSSCGSGGAIQIVVGSAIAGTRRSTGNSRASAWMSRGSSCVEPLGVAAARGTS